MGLSLLSPAEGQSSAFTPEGRAFVPFLMLFQQIPFKGTLNPEIYPSGSQTQRLRAPWRRGPLASSWPQPSPSCWGWVMPPQGSSCGPPSPRLAMLYWHCLSTLQSLLVEYTFKGSHFQVLLTSCGAAQACHLAQHSAGAHYLMRWLGWAIWGIVLQRQLMQRQMLA